MKYSKWNSAGAQEVVLKAGTAKTRKTRVMHGAGMPKANLWVGGADLEEIDSYVYLSQEVNKGQNLYPESACQKSAGWHIFYHWKRRHRWRQKEISWWWRKERAGVEDAWTVSLWLPLKLSVRQSDLGSSSWPQEKTESLGETCCSPSQANVAYYWVLGKKTRILPT